MQNSDPVNWQAFTNAVLARLMALTCITHGDPASKEMAVANVWKIQAGVDIHVFEEEIEPTAAILCTPTHYAYRQTQA